MSHSILPTGILSSLPPSRRVEAQQIAIDSCLYKLAEILNRPFQYAVERVHKRHHLYGDGIAWMLRKIGTLPEDIQRFCELYCDSEGDIKLKTDVINTPKVPTKGTIAQLQMSHAELVDRCMEKLSAHFGVELWEVAEMMIKRHRSNRDSMEWAANIVGEDYMRLIHLDTVIKERLRHEWLFGPEQKLIEKRGA